MTVEDYWDHSVDFNTLKGRTVVAVEGMTEGNDVVTFVLSDGAKMVLWHEQDCCERVDLVDVHGDPDDLLGEILEAEEEIDGPYQDEEYGDSVTWTFYKIGTIKGRVTLRWQGESNGYYSESVNCALIEGGR